MSRLIPYLDLSEITRSYGGDIEKAVAAVAASGRYLNGPELECFEKEYARYIGTNHAIGCGSGLDALRLMLQACILLGRMQRGDEVIVPANTFIATILAVSSVGLIPVLVEPNPDTLNIDENKIEEAITPRTRAVMIVHLYGRCAFTPRIAEICKNHSLYLFEDNAQAHGCIVPGSGQRTGSVGDAAAHSFYPGKNLGALGDAGAVTTDDTELAEMVRILGNYGSEKKYEFLYEGFNSRMDEIQAAVLRIKLRRLDEDNAVREKLAQRYCEEIKNDAIATPKEWQQGSNVFHIFPVLSPARDALQKHFMKSGIGTLIHYPIPPHRQECYADGELKIPLNTDGSPNLPITEQIHLQELSLPLSPSLSDDDASRVIQVANSF